MSQPTHRLNTILNQLSPNVTNGSTGGCPRQRAVIVDGMRTPFVKSFTDIMDVDSIGLGVAAVGGLLQKVKLDPIHVDELIMGNVVVQSAAPNIAREIVLDLHLPRTIPGTTVSVACLSGLEAVNQAVQTIECGNANTIIAGGSDSLSSGELPMPKKLTLALGKYSMGGGNKNGMAGVQELLSTAGPISTWFPKANSVSERSTGKTMGYHADLMAEINAIPRTEQDKFAVASHKNAAAAVKKGYFKNEVVPVKNGKGKLVSTDNLIREKTSYEAAAKLGPAFRPAPNGTVTAASSSALTDGASAVLVMSESKAKELGYPTDIVVRSYAKVAIDPFPELLLAPAIAIPRALEKAGLTLDQIDLWEIHEAFAAQVLATTKCLASVEFAKKFLNRSTAVGVVDPAKININGGSIAIGHPFAATGGRLVTSTAAELRRSGKRFALISICAAGGIGGVMILENVNAKN